MKRFKLLLSMLLFVCIGFAQTQTRLEEVSLQVKIIDPTEYGKEIKKGPVLIPTLSIEGHNLYFVTSCEDCILQLVQDDNVIYSTIITSEIVELPESLSGTYELQIIRGNYCFWADIEL